MKFAEHLSAHITPEWRKQYISYEVQTDFICFVSLQTVYMSKFRLYYNIKYQMANDIHEFYILKELATFLYIIILDLSIIIDCELLLLRILYP